MLLQCSDVLGKGYYDALAYLDMMSWTICAHDPPHSICAGDSGGPFICEEDGKAILYGVVVSSRASTQTYKVRNIIVNHKT